MNNIRTKVAICQALFSPSDPLLCQPQLMHSSMDGRLRLQERPFQIGLMVLLSVVMRHGTRLIPWAQLADIGETAVDQREHVLCCLLVKEPPITPTGHIDQRGVCP